MTISDEAVEAAAKVLYERARIDRWENARDYLAEEFRHDARQALVAAAPHMLAEAWDEGEEAGALNHAAEGYPHLEQVANPYRIPRG